MDPGIRKEGRTLCDQSADMVGMQVGKQDIVHLIQSVSGSRDVACQLQRPGPRPSPLPASTRICPSPVLIR